MNKELNNCCHASSFNDNNYKKKTSGTQGTICYGKLTGLTMLSACSDYQLAEF